MSCKPHDKDRIERTVRNVIISALRNDLQGDELVMKEAWEECGSEDETAIAEAELGAIIAMIKERGA